MTAAFLDEFRSSTPTCDRCGRTHDLRKVKVGNNPETLCPTCRAAFDAEPVWVDRKEYKTPKHNQDGYDV